MSNYQLPQYRTDYIVSWDISDSDFPVITVSQIRREGASVVGEVIGFTHEKSGSISIRQVIEEYEENKRREEKED